MIELKYFNLDDMSYTDPVSHSVYKMEDDYYTRDCNYRSLIIHCEKGKMPLIKLMVTVFNKVSVESIIAYCDSMLSGLKMPVKRMDGCVYFHKTELCRYLKLIEQEIEKSLDIKNSGNQSDMSSIKIHFE